MWAFQTDSYSYALSWAQLREGWNEIFSKPAPIRRQVRGTLSAMQLSLARIERGMSGYVTCISDFCEKVQMTTIPPAMLRNMLRQASMRPLERDSARKHNVQCERLCFTW